MPRPTSASGPTVEPHIWELASGAHRDLFWTFPSIKSVDVRDADGAATIARTCAPPPVARTRRRYSLGRARGVAVLVNFCCISLYLAVRFKRVRVRDASSSSSSQGDGEARMWKQQTLDSRPLQKYLMSAHRMMFIGLLLQVFSHGKHLEIHLKKKNHISGGKCLLPMQCVLLLCYYCVIRPELGKHNICTWLQLWVK